jgi:hypothetical protein
MVAVHRSCFSEIFGIIPLHKADEHDEALRRWIFSKMVQVTMMRGQSGGVVTSHHQIC